MVLKQQFGFSTTDIFDSGDHCLALQVSDHHFSFCIYHPEDGKLQMLKRYAISDLTEQQLQRIIDDNPLLQSDFHKIMTSLDFGFSSLLPSENGTADAEPLMYLEKADQQHHVISEPIEERAITNKYAVAPEVLSGLVQHFPSSSYLHAHTVQIKSIADLYEEGLLKVDVSENKFTVVAFKSNQVLLAKTYSYHAIADMAFYLLKICEVFDLAQERVVVQVSGLIDVHSKLYKELYDYFLHISFRPAQWVDEITDLPNHYFTSLNELIQCELFQEA